MSEQGLITASRVKGTDVFSAEGEKIGRIEDLSIEKQSGQVRLALVSFGGFLGIGERFHILPWRMLSYDLGKDGYVTSLSRDKLERAPTYGMEDLAAFGGDERPPMSDFDYYGGY
jgi:sporulation protein YlmC with PRC-barrel domain